MNLISVGRIIVISGLLAFGGCSKPSSTSGTSAESSSSLSGSNSAPSSAAGSMSGNAPASGAPQAMQSAPVPPPTSIPPVIVHSGTRISVVVDQAVSSKTSNLGDHFDASLASSVVVDGKRVIPRGARVVGTVSDAKSAGKFHGNAAITVTLDSIRVNGERYPIRTSSITQAGKGRGKRTGIGAGGGAVVGGIIGALAGGGKGAAIGAGAGAGAGAAGAGFTGDRDIEINAETNLSFTLRKPLEIPAN
jgi:hypothetical protein